MLLSMLLIVLPSTMNPFSTASWKKYYEKPLQQSWYQWHLIGCIKKKFVRCVGYQQEENTTDDHYQAILAYYVITSAKQFTPWGAQKSNPFRATHALSIGICPHGILVPLEVVFMPWRPQNQNEGFISCIQKWAPVYVKVAFLDIKSFPLVALLGNSRVSDRKSL